MIKSDKWIKEMALKYEMIKPFEENQVRKGNISYGLSSYGYDIRISEEFQIFNPLTPALSPEGRGKRGTALSPEGRGQGEGDIFLDPKNVDKNLFKKIVSKECIIPPNTFVLAKSLEYFKIPRNVITACYGKSTYARCGVIVNVTPFEPHWEGFATISISNTANIPVKIYAGEGIAQLLFFESGDACLTSYADKNGKYQAQKQITHAKIQ